jgi:hypothetical protein
MAMYSIRSERAFCEPLNYELLFKWLLDMRIDQPAFDATTFTKNRTRLLEHEVADEFFAAVVRQAKLRRYASSEHFTVDGTLGSVGVVQELQTQSGPPPPWDQSGGRNAEVQWHGQKRSNDNHASPTDPEVRLCRKSSNIAATLCYSGHLLMENRSALIVDAELTSAGRVRRAGSRSRDARPAPDDTTPADRCRRQGLRHRRVRRQRPRVGVSRRMSTRTPRTVVLRSTGAPPAIAGIR